MFDIILVIVLLIAVGALLTENSLYLIKRRSKPSSSVNPCSSDLAKAISIPTSKGESYGNHR